VAEQPEPKGGLDLSRDTKRIAFLTAEFASLREEISLQVSERRKVETQTFIGLAVLYAWMFSGAADLSPFYLTASFVVAFVFALLGWIRWVGMMTRTMALGTYNYRIEAELVGDGGGWEHYLAEIRHSKPLIGRLEGVAEVAAWAVVVLGTGSIMVFGLTHPTHIRAISETVSASVSTPASPLSIAPATTANSKLPAK
jgi:hypothetical protein